MVLDKYLFSHYVQWIMLPYVVISSYRRLADYLSQDKKKITGDFYSNSGSQCRFVIKRGHIITILFRVKFISNTINKMQKSRILRKLRAFSWLWSLNINLTLRTRQAWQTTSHFKNCKHSWNWWLYLASTWQMQFEYQHAWHWLINSWKTLKF